jgi:repressor LexA
MKLLTQKQQIILEFVSDFSCSRGFSPSLREIGEAIGLPNVSAVRGHVAALERKGYIRKEPDKPRSISVIQSPSLMSLIKRKLHEFARTDEGVIHKVAYGIVLATKQCLPLLQPEIREYLDESLARLCTEHGWKLANKRVKPNHIVIVIEVWPNHSPELTVARIRTSIENLLKRHKLLKNQHLWTKGYAVTTDLEQLDEIERQFVATCR